MKIKQYIFQFKWQITLLLTICIISATLPGILESKNLTQKVLVARKNISIGTKFSLTDVVVKNVAKGIMPKGVLTSCRQIIGKQSSSFIPAGNVIAESMTADVGSLNNIPDNKVIISIAITNGESLKGGDKIDLIGQTMYMADVESKSDFLAQNAIVISKNKEIQVAVDKAEAENILTIPAETKIHAILIH